jgi:hypothetical protein
LSFLAAMNCNGCDGCGKGYPEVKQIFFCKCFLVGFCSPDCFEKSGHLNECESIAGPLSRVRGKNDFGKHLSDYTWSLYHYAAATGAEKQMKQVETFTALQEIKSRDEKRNDNLQILLKGWNNKNLSAIDHMQQGQKRSAEAELNEVKNASDTLIAIFKAENRLSLRQRGKDIENAWNSYLQSLRDAILEISSSEGATVAYSKFNTTAMMAINVGNVLGGGKDTSK